MLIVASILHLTLLISAPSHLHASQESDFQTITVKPGDTLWGIANTYLKDSKRWNELLQYNKQLSSDPATALPGMALRIPVEMLKPHLRAAFLSYVESDVFYRARGGTEWVKAKLHMPLYADDMLKTGSLSRARIKFPLGSVLNLDSNSVVAIKPQSEPQDVDLKLLRGKLRALHVKLKAQTTAITPKTNDTIYEAAIKDDASVKVEVYGGAANVQAGESGVDVAIGYSVEVPEGLTPARPRKMAETDVTPAKAPAVRKIDAMDQSMPTVVTTNLGHLDVDFKSLPIGSTLAGFRLQASQTSDFKKIAFDQMFEVDEEINIRKMPLRPGAYWWRVAPVDLLGVTGNFSKPKEQFLK